MTVVEPRAARIVEFPESDGEPVAETERHFDQIVYLHGALRTWFAARDPGVHVGANLLFYWDPLDPRRSLAPDVYLARGLRDPAMSRRTYELWDEGKGPDLVVEVSSTSTIAADLGTKMEVYRRVFRVREYVLFDPEGLALPDGPLQGYRLVRGRYRRVDAGDRLESDVTGLSFQVRGDWLRLVDPATHLVLPGSAAEGIEQARRADVVRVLETRFGPVPPALRARIHGNRHGEQLLLLAVRADSLESFARAMPDA